MPRSFRCYFVARDGHFLSRFEFEVATLSEARQRGRELLAGNPWGAIGFEIWLKGQKMFDSLAPD